MIQPITLGGFKSESFSFRNSSSAAAIPAEIDKNANLLNSVKKDDKLQGRNDMLILGSITALSLSTIFLFPKIVKKVRNKSSGDIVIKGFESLKNNDKIPTLSNCKSINKDLKGFLENQVYLSNATPDDLKHTGMPTIKNRLILYGPPGAGKSFFAKIYTKTINAQYKEIQYADINSRWCGEGIENLVSVFDDIIKSARKSPEKKFVVTFNEIDTFVQPVNSISGKNRTGGSTYWLTKLEERSTFLNYLDQLNEKAPNVTIIGTTNLSPRNNGLDGAAMSRFKNIMEVSYPDKECLSEALKANLLDMPHGNIFIDKNVDNITNFVQQLEARKCSYRDLNNIIESSKNYYLRDYLKDKNSCYKYEYLEKALKDVNLTDGEISGAL